MFIENTEDITSENSVFPKIYPQKSHFDEIYFINDFPNLVF